MKNLMLIAVLCCIACDTNQQPKVQLLPMEKMQQTVWQLMQADEYLSRQTQTDTSFQPNLEKAKYYQRVFDLNKVDRVQFYATMDYLDKHPMDLKVLMDSVEALSKREKLALIKH